MWLCPVGLGASPALGGRPGLREATLLHPAMDEHGTAKARLAPGLPPRWRGAGVCADTPAWRGAPGRCPSPTPETPRGRHPHLWAPDYPVEDPVEDPDYLEEDPEEEEEEEEEDPEEDPEEEEYELPPREARPLSLAPGRLPGACADEEGSLYLGCRGDPGPQESARPPPVPERGAPRPPRAPARPRPGLPRAPTGLQEARKPGPVPGAREWGAPCREVPGAAQGDEQDTYLQCEPGPARVPTTQAHKPASDRAVPQGTDPESQAACSSSPGRRRTGAESAESRPSHTWIALPVPVLIRTLSSQVLTPPDRLPVTSAVPRPPKAPQEARSARGRSPRASVAPPRSAWDTEDGGLRGQPWYSESSDRHAVERALLGVQKDGAFTVRPSSGPHSNQPFALAVLLRGHVFHVPVCQLEGRGHYALGRHGRGHECFSSVAAMVQHYARHPLTLVDRHSGSRELTCLLFPTKP